MVIRKVVTYLQVKRTFIPMGLSNHSQWEIQSIEQVVWKWDSASRKVEVIPPAMKMEDGYVAGLLKCYVGERLVTVVEFEYMLQLLKVGVTRSDIDKVVRV